MAGHKLLINISELSKALQVHNNVSSWGEHSEHLPSDFDANFCTFSTQTDIKIKALYNNRLTATPLFCFGAWQLALIC